ncbi:unnamed protein product, partial [Brenthis ino]
MAIMSVIKKHFIWTYKGFMTRNICFTKTARYLSQVAVSKTTVNKTAQIDFLKTELGNSNNAWNDLKSSVLNKPGSINQKNIDAVILKILVTTKKFDAALSFANHLRSSNEELSLGVINGLLHFYYEYAKENALTENERDFILNSYKYLYDKYKILDYSTNEKLLHALCSINEWRKCMKMLDDFHLSGTPSHSAFSTLIGTLFRNNRKAEAFIIIDRSVNNRRPLQDYAYNEWIKYILRKYKDKKFLAKYLNEICFHISDNCAIVSAVTAQRLKESFEILNWHAKFAAVQKHSGECTGCNKALDCLKLTEEEFSILQNNVKEKLIVGSDLLLKSSPEELKRFLDFMEKTAPYDIVLDALNIAFTVGEPYHRIRVLNYVVDYFNSQNKKLLLLGRKHMLRWQRGALLNIMKKTENFFIDDISQDDPYFITAAILSGSNTDIVSRDLLRGHRFLLQQDKLQRVFQRWQWQHQWMVFVPKYKPIIQAPLKFTPLAQQSSNGWHLPYLAENASTSGQVSDGVHDCASWLCLKSS